jgi:predicted alpha/beta hydrolase family esterase
MSRPEPRVLILPGWGDSGPEHWQSLWQARNGYERVTQTNWERAERTEWVATLDRAVRAASTPTLLVAHSLACALVAHWAAGAAGTSVKGALLVGPADVDSEMHTPDEVRSFAPMPMAPLPFPAIVVASRTDPYVRFVRAEAMAKAWAARLVDAGRVGHLNPDAGFGEWPEGVALLGELLVGAAKSG